MKVLSSIALISLSLIAGAASAADVPTNPDSSYPVIAESGNSPTRAQVLNELAAARASGELNQPDHQYPANVASVGSESRQQVLQELALYKSTHANEHISG